MTWLLLAAAYLTGAIPTSFVVGRVRGVDLRRHGSGNLGASNAYRVLGWKAALPIFVVDIAKGWFPAFAFPLWDGQPSPSWALGYGAASIMGHVFSIYVGFKGGKGVATSAGVVLALAPMAMLIGLGTWGFLAWVTGYVSLASMVAAIVVAVTVWVLAGSGPVLWLTLALAVFVVFAHRANIRRLRAGTENRFGRRTREAR
ncbi:MAG: glycerol-3-phosphate 1-O-acyltransferase PlsY [Longimicrobiales bacterium]